MVGRWRVVGRVGGNGGQQSVTEGRTFLQSQSGFGQDFHGSRNQDALPDADALDLRRPFRDTKRSLLVPKFPSDVNLGFLRDRMASTRQAALDRPGSCDCACFHGWEFEFQGIRGGDISGCARGQEGEDRRPQDSVPVLRAVRHAVINQLSGCRKENREIKGVR